MQGKEELEIFISEEGEVKMHIKGIKGPACRDVAKNLAVNIGNIREMVNTVEFYQQPETKQQIKGTGQKSR